MRASRLLVAGIAGTVLGGFAAAQTEPVLSGTFIQLNGALTGLSQEAWLEELGHMKALGFDTLIIQYSRYGGDSYYRDEDTVPGEAGLPANESIGTMEWQAPEGFETKHLRLTVLPASREWTMIPEVRVLADGSNIAAGLPYRLSPAPAGDYTDPGAHEGGKLTDGAANFAWADMVGWQNPGDRIVIDLELPEATAIQAVEADFMRSDTSAVELPAGFTVSASPDGSAWEQAGPQADWAAAAGEDAPRDPIGNVLAAAEQERLSVWLGLALDPDYWSGRFDPDASAAENSELLLELERLYGDSPALSGWYLPEEIDDRSFVTPLTREAMFSYLEMMTETAHSETGRPVMVAPYFGMNPQPKEIAAWWDAALDRAAIDVIAMQDGVGTRRTTVEEGVPVYRELAAVTARHGTELWSDLEIFEQIHGWPVDERAFAAVPARIETVTSQLEQEAPFVSKFVSFDFTHHMSPRLGGEAERLYREYSDWLKEREAP